MLLEQLDTHMQSNKSIYMPYTFKKNLTQNRCNLNVKCKTTKLLEDNMRENLDDLGFNYDFFRYNTKGLIHERKN